jgi:hypothetical protein
MKAICPKSTLLATLFTAVNLVLVSPASAQVVILQPGPGLNDGTDEGGPNGGKDAYIYELTPESNYGTLNVAYGLGPSNCNATYGKAYVKFDVSTLPSAVTQVFLGVTHPVLPYCYSNCDVNFYGYAVTQAWNEMTLTWQNQPTEGAAAFGPVNITSPSSQVLQEFDITNTYTAWKSGSLANHGLVFHGDPTVFGCNNAAVGFGMYTSDETTVAYRPYLRVVQGTPTAGNTGPYCAGGTISLTASTIADATYSWTGPNGYTSTAQNPTIPNATTAMSGTYSVTATVTGVTSPAGTTIVTVEGALALHPIPSPVVVGSSHTLFGCSFTAGSRIMVFVATASGASAYGPYTPTSWSSVSLVWLVNPSIGLGNGFATFMVVNTDQGYIQSNTQSQLLYGDPTRNIPTIMAVNGVGLRPADPTIPTANVETVITQGTTVTLTGTGFSNTLVNLFTAAGNKGPLTPLAGATSTQIQVVVPADTPTGPGAFQAVNSPYTGNVLSNAVSVPIGSLVTISHISLSGNVVTVTGTGFCSLTVINLFAETASGVQNLGGLNGSGTSLIPLTIDSETQFHFTRPAAALAGAAYVMAINPPFISYSSSGVGPSGGLLLP